MVTTPICTTKSKKPKLPASVALDYVDGINNSAVKSIKDEYTNLDNQLAEFNRKPQSGEESGG